MVTSDSFKESAYSPETDDVWLVLGEIAHADLAENIYVVNNLENVESNGQLYHACPFEISLPDDTEDGPPKARVRIDNVAQDVVAALRQINTPATVTLQVVMASDPDTVEAEWSGLTLRDITANVATVTGVLGLDDLRLEPFPAHSFSPSFFPGAF